MESDANFTQVLKDNAHFRKMRNKAYPPLLETTIRTFALASKSTFLEVLQKPWENFIFNNKIYVFTGKFFLEGHNLKLYAKLSITISTWTKKFCPWTKSFCEGKKIWEIAIRKGSKTVNKEMTSRK